MMEIDTTPRRVTNADLNEAVALLDEAIQTISDASGYTDTSRTRMHFKTSPRAPETLTEMMTLLDFFVEQICKRMDA